jgi:predicted XRE-type DNA-binding protein
MPTLDSPKHEIMAQSLARGETQRKAYENAGYRFQDLNSLDSHASRLASNGKVIHRVTELQEQAAMKTEITIQGQIEKLERLLLAAEQVKQYAAAIAASREQSELSGLKIQRLESKRIDAFAAMSDEELERYVNGSGDAGSEALQPARALSADNGTDQED